MLNFTPVLQVALLGFSDTNTARESLAEVTGNVTYKYKFIFNTNIKAPSYQSFFFRSITCLKEIHRQTTGNSNIQRRELQTCVLFVNVSNVIRRLQVLFIINNHSCFNTNVAVIM